MMDREKRYEVHGPDGIALGYFLDRRLYEYRTSTCIGFLNEQGQLVDENKLLGRVEGNQLLRNDGTVFNISE